MVEAHTGDDDLVCVVTVRTLTGTYRRPVTKVVLLHTGSTAFIPVLYPPLFLFVKDLRSWLAVCQARLSYYLICAIISPLPTGDFVHAQYKKESDRCT